MNGSPLKHLQCGVIHAWKEATGDKIILFLVSLQLG